MATQYFFTHGGAQFGPYSGNQLQELANAGKIQPTDAVWRAGVGKAIPAWRVKHLFPGAQQPAASPEAAAPEGVALDTTEDAASDSEAKAASAFTPAEEKPAPKPAEKERLRRVVSIRGGVLGSQDGKYVQYRKKCETCGYTEQGKNTTLIRPGTMKVPFFCRKCRKGRTCEMSAVWG